jgi:hypothetical protein
MDAAPFHPSILSSVILVMVSAALPTDPWKLKKKICGRETDFIKQDSRLVNNTAHICIVIKALSYSRIRLRSIFIMAQKRNNDDNAPDDTEERHIAEDPVVGAPLEGSGTPQLFVHVEPGESDVAAQGTPTAAQQNTDSAATTPAAGGGPKRRVRRRASKDQEVQPHGYYLRHHHGYDLRFKPMK